MDSEKKEYTELRVRLPIEKAREFKSKCAKDGLSQAQNLRMLIHSYMENNNANTIRPV